jgi:phosphoribosylanthranilate isomerase
MSFSASNNDKELFVKICGITNQEDALLAVALGADALGFVFAPSRRQISPLQARSIVERLPREIVTIGVFRNERPERVVEVVNSLRLKGAQLHGDETREGTRWVAERVPLVIKAFPAGDPGIERFEEWGAHLLLVDGPAPGSGEVFDWSLVEGVADHSQLIVSGGLNPSNVADAVEATKPFGVDVASGVEIRPASAHDGPRKDPSLLREFISRARAAHRDVLASRESSDLCAGSLWAAHHGAKPAPYDWNDPEESWPEESW